MHKTKDNVYKVALFSATDSQEISLQPCSSCLDSYSLSKIFIVTAIGLLYDQKQIDLNEKVVDIFKDEYEFIDQNWKLVTIEMLLTHRCGFKPGYLDIDIEPISDYPHRDFLQYLFSSTLQYIPGTATSYSDAAYYLLARIIEKKSTLSLNKLLWEKVFIPLHFNQIAMSTCPLGHVIGATGFFVSTFDLAKLGYLYINKGLYQSQQILSEDWINLVLKKEFGFQQDEMIYYKDGMYGQMLLLIPSLKISLAWQSFSYQNQSHFIQWIKQYVKTLY